MELSINIDSIIKCESCGKLKPTSVTKKVGDKVMFGKCVKSSRQSVRVSRTQGTIVGIEGDYVLVRGRGRSGTHKRAASSLTDADGKSALSMALLGSCQCGFTAGGKSS